MTRLRLIAVGLAVAVGLGVFIQAGSSDHPSAGELGRAGSFAPSAPRTIEASLAEPGVFEWKFVRAAGATAVEVRLNNLDKSPSRTSLDDFFVSGYEARDTLPIRYLIPPRQS